MIEGELHGDAAVIARLERMPESIHRQVVDRMRRLWFEVQTNVVREKLSGDPLHRVTGNLASSINSGGTDSATTFEESDTEIVGRVGTKVRYGAVHEDGGSFEVPSHSRTITQVYGRPVTPREVVVAAYTAHFPQRAFLRPVLEEMRERIQSEIAAAAAEGAQVES